MHRSAHMYKGNWRSVQAQCVCLRICVCACGHATRAKEDKAKRTIICLLAIPQRVRHFFLFAKVHFSSARLQLLISMNEPTRHDSTSWWLNSLVCQPHCEPQKPDNVQMNSSPWLTCIVSPMNFDGQWHRVTATVCLNARNNTIWEEEEDAFIYCSAALRKKITNLCLWHPGTHAHVAAHFVDHWCRLRRASWNNMMEIHFLCVYLYFSIIHPWII